MDYKEDQLYEKVEKALQAFFKKDGQLLHINANERSTFFFIGGVFPQFFSKIKETTSRLFVCFSNYNRREHSMTTFVFLNRDFCQQPINGITLDRVDQCLF